MKNARMRTHHKPFNVSIWNWTQYKNSVNQTSQIASCIYKELMLVNCNSGYPLLFATYPLDGRFRNDHLHHGIACRLHFVKSFFTHSCVLQTYISWHTYSKWKHHRPYGITIILYWLLYYISDNSVEYAWWWFCFKGALSAIITRRMRKANSQ